ncbi:MAG: hypothetical protein JWP12_1547 [Bacteroidetes bacterium]|nr:hypothetical protein [Bacteroidota bacterium]
MKKVLFIAVVAVASLASCKKDRTCTCTSSNSVSGADPIPTVKTYTKAKKGDARAACLSYTRTETGGSVTTVDCKLD